LWKCNTLAFIDSIIIIDYAFYVMKIITQKVIKSMPRLIITAHCPVGESEFDPDVAEDDGLDVIPPSVTPLGTTVVAFPAADWNASRVSFDYVNKFEVGSTLGFRAKTMPSWQ